MAGFKSYADKTTIRNLDRNFTAITGTNGSGKSNIIDAVIFALDLGTSSKMRVSSLKELINTQRTECSVTLHFDNSDTTTSPPGYEHLSEIELFRSLDSEGRSKHKINGHACTKSTVEALCKSVGITDNFVVLQGHITKILNMKSTELREMIEEAAGTRSYNAEKIKACYALEKKEERLVEVKELLKKSVAPFVAKLNDDRRLYEEQKELRESEGRLREELAELKQAREEAELANQMIELNRLVNEFDSHSSELRSVEERLEGFESEGGIEDLVSLKARLEEMMSQFEEVRTQLEEAESKLGEVRAEREEIKMLNKQDSIKPDLPGETLDEIMERKEYLVEREKVLNEELYDNGIDKITKLEGLKQELLKLKVCYSGNEIREPEISKLVERIEKNNHIIRKYRSYMKEDARDVDTMMEYHENIMESDDKTFIVETILKYNSCFRQFCEKLEETGNTIKGRLRYPLTRGVHGTVDENFTLKDPRYEEAVNVILGGRAKFVICDTDEIASEVLSKSRNRVSCIPLNKIVGGRFNGQNGSLGCVSALEVVNYDRKYEKAFQFIFGGYLIFEDKKEAQKCCFENKITCITLDGSVYDPRGTLTGGKMGRREEVVYSAELRIIESILQAVEIPENDGDLSEWLKRTRNLKEEEKKAKCIEKKIAMMEMLCEKRVDVKKEVERVRDELQAVQRREREIRKVKMVMERLEEKESKLREETRMKEKEKGVIQNELEMLKKKVRGVEERNGKRRMSINEIESLELKKKQLLKETMRLSARINRLVEKEVCETEKGAVEEEMVGGDLASVKYTKNKLNNEFTDTENFTNTNLLEARATRINLMKRFLRSLRGTGQVDIKLIDRKYLKSFENLEDKERINMIEKDIESIERMLNKKGKNKVMVDSKNFELLDKHVEMVRELQQKIERLEDDRMKITQSIEKLSELGLEENKRAFESINANLGRFFKYFVKNAEVVIEENYEIRIKMGGWVNSLAELSGGQRSLVALSLIFSMLAYKPAPLYIFDEIDAALDMNYTQSIGEIIRKEFKNAQFLIVSLKSNMFDNANRIYRVYLQDNKPKISQIK